MKKEEVIQELKMVLEHTKSEEVSRVVNGVLAFLDK